MSASLSKLLTNAITFPGSVVVYSGVAHKQSTQVYNALLGWWGMSYTIDAPPPGQVLWYSFFIDWQMWTWNSWGPHNSSNKQMRVDFSLNWRWELIANPFFFPDPLPLFMTDFGHYAFYSSVAPGGSGFNAGWIVPAKSVVLTADSKESDPNPLQLLLGTNVNGNLRLWWRGQLTNMLVNGQEAHGYTAGGSPSVRDIFWSCAVVLPRVPDVSPPNAGGVSVMG
jgi:hypothetical protein